MARHKVTFSVREQELGKVDLELLAKRDGQILGRLKLSKGMVEWVAKSGQKGHTMTWSQFAQLMEENGARE